MRDEPSLRRTRLVAVTGYGRPEDVRQAREAGFDDHMTKPVDPTSLLHAIDGSGA
jgi:CheY-like chemotaxis protein